MVGTVGYGIGSSVCFVTIIVVGVGVYIGICICIGISWCYSCNYISCCGAMLPSM